MTDLRDQELARLRAMTPADKLRVADRLRADAFRLVRAAVTRLHPTWTEKQVRDEVVRRVNGG